MRNRSRRVWTTASIATAAVLIAAFLTGAALLNSSSSSPLPTGRGRVLSFKLPYLERGVDNPNAQEVAQHVAGDAPLLIFLPATGEVPNDYREYLSTAVSVGYNVLGLDYWNVGKSVTRTCRGHAHCYTMLQQNRFDGTSPSRYSRVDAANSILRRFRAAIDYLDTQDPGGYWARFLVNGHPDWTDVVLAGHSQGGGESAFISHFHEVRGVLMYSSPVETYGDVSASWMGSKGATPVSRMYGFDDVHDLYLDRITDSWAKLGMGEATVAGARSVPTGHHVMLSSLDIGTPLESHGHTVNDFGPRTTKGTMRFEPTWRWMLQQVMHR